MTRRGLGFRPDSNPGLPTRTVRGGGLPESVGLPPPAKIYDQGDTQACVAHALSTAIAIRTAGEVEASRRWIYSNAVCLHNECGVDNGTYFSAAVRVLQELGFADEKDIPWLPDDPTRLPTVTERARAWRMHDRIQLTRLDPSITQVKWALLYHEPVICGIPVSERWFDLGDHDWPVPPLRDDEHWAGWHAVVVHAVDNEQVHIVNSWGRQWGNRGKGLIPTNWFERHARDIMAVYL